MKHAFTTLLLVLIISFGLFFGIGHPQVAQALPANCVTVATGGPGPGTTTVNNISMNAGDLIYASWGTGNASPIITINIVFPGGTASGTNAVSGTATAAGTASVTFNANTGYAYSIQVCPASPTTSAPASYWIPGDDRLNTDPGQPAALYCRNGGDVQVWKVDSVTSSGSLVLNVTKNEIAAAESSNATTNILIKASSDSKFRLYYLPATEELAFITTYANSNKPYSFVWKGCS